MSSHDTCTAFERERLIASGPLPDVVRVAKHALDTGTIGPLLIFDDRSSRQLEVDFRGTTAEVLARLTPDTPDVEPSSRSRGRPRLGVVPREVTLMPRHWDWLGQQPGGASAVIRRLVEHALRNSGAKERAAQSTESVDRFMRVMAGDLAGYEEASRAFYRGDRLSFAELIDAWPQDVRAHLKQLAAIAWDERADAD
ncbi:DUF2239 family protein [Rhodanobacter sp. L36]|uniref:DUF2239 family protein n=1 Tax=Rhodanobacter sp. L36 TaxID=1747221 RepID=UPI00131DF32F|nr:DUF2239 family protein [Rhodanobacter sp. L36]